MNKKKKIIKYKKQKNKTKVQNKTNNIKSKYQLHLVYSFSIGLQCKLLEILPAGIVSLVCIKELIFVESYLFGSCITVEKVLKYFYNFT